MAAELNGCDQSLTVLDRAYFSASFLLGPLKFQVQHPHIEAGGVLRHWLMRAKDNLRHEVVATHAKGDCTIRMPGPPRAQ